MLYLQTLILILHPYLSCLLTPSSTVTTIVSPFFPSQSYHTTHKSSTKPCLTFETNNEPLLILLFLTRSLVLPPLYLYQLLATQSIFITQFTFMNRLLHPYLPPFNFQNSFTFSTNCPTTNSQSHYKPLSSPNSLLSSILPPF